MATKEVKAAKAELRLVDDQVQNLLQRKSDLEAFIRVHDTLKPVKGKRTRPRSEETQQITDAVMRIFATQGYPRHTKDLALALKVQGLPPIEEQKLSQILSRDKDRFVASRKHGWSPKKAEARGNG